MRLTVKLTDTPPQCPKQGLATEGPFLSSPLRRAGRCLRTPCQEVWALPLHRGTHHRRGQHPINHIRRHDSCRRRERNFSFSTSPKHSRTSTRSTTPKSTGSALNAKTASFRIFPKFILTSMHTRSTRRIGEGSHTRHAPGDPWRRAANWCGTSSKIDTESSTKVHRFACLLPGVGRHRNPPRRPGWKRRRRQDARRPNDVRYDRVRRP